MKKIVAVSSLLVGVFFLAGCGQQQAIQTPPATPAPVAKQPNTPVATQPAPVTPHTTEKNPQEVIYNLLKEDEYKKDKAVTILKSNSNYILASISAKPDAFVPGYMIWAARINGEWKEVYEGNGECDKKLLTKNSFPQEWIAENECL